MSKRERKIYDKAFKLIAVELYRTASPPGTVAKELGIGIDMVRRWAGEHSETGNRSFLGNGKQDLTPEQGEILKILQSETGYNTVYPKESYLSSSKYGTTGSVHIIF